MKKKIEKLIMKTLKDEKKDWKINDEEIEKKL